MTGLENPSWLGSGLQAPFKSQEHLKRIKALKQAQRNAFSTVLFLAIKVLVNLNQHNQEQLPSVYSCTQLPRGLTMDQYTSQGETRNLHLREHQTRGRGHVTQEEVCLHISGR